jgi:hypothetical protein
MITYSSVLFCFFTPSNQSIDPIPISDRTTSPSVSFYHHSFAHAAVAGPLASTGSLARYSRPVMYRKPSPPKATLLVCLSPVEMSPGYQWQ